MKLCRLEAEYPLPESDSDIDLTTGFADFVEEKIEKIRRTFDPGKKYNPTLTSVCSLENVSEVTEEFAKSYVLQKLQHVILIQSPPVSSRN